MRSTRLPTPLQAPPPTPVPAAHAAATSQAAAAAAQAAQALAAEAGEEPYDDGQQDTGYDTEPYEAVGDELESHQQDDNELRVLTLEEEVAQLRLQIHRLHAELSRQRRIHRQQQELSQLSTGPYWISRTPRR